jgi:flagellar FliJ protein
MAAFRFGLARILKLRQRAEDETARRLGAQLSRRGKILRELEEMEDLARQLRRERERLQEGEIRVELLPQNRHQLQALARGRELALARLAEIESEITRTREELLERSRKRKALEKLRERRHEEYLENEKRRETREMDDRPRGAHGTRIA